MVENKISAANKSEWPIIINVLSIENAVRSDTYLRTLVLKNSVFKELPWWFSWFWRIILKKMIECLPSLNNFGKTSVRFSHLHKEN